MPLGSKNENSGGVTQETKREVAERDNYSCVNSANHTGKDSEGIIDPPHHIFRKSIYQGEDRDEPWNLTLLCRSCHSSLHPTENKELDKRLKEMALRRYEGENKDTLKRIYQSKGYENKKSNSTSE